jgi:predicted HAD superfamily Cof-like phosphohydrolase
MKTNFELVKEFHQAFNKVPDPTVPADQPAEIRQLRAKLINEEFNEVLQELGHTAVDFGGDPVGYISDNYSPLYGLQRPFDTFDINKLAKELADLLYVVYGTAAAYGIPIDDVYREVHRSNMSKLGEDGKPIYREDGKVLKGPNYSPANVEKILKV